MLNKKESPVGSFFATFAGCNKTVIFGVYAVGLWLQGNGALLTRSKDE